MQAHGAGLSSQTSPRGAAGLRERTDFCGEHDSLAAAEPRARERLGGLHEAGESICTAVLIRAVLLFFSLRQVLHQADDPRLWDASPWNPCCSNGYEDSYLEVDLANPSIILLRLLFVVPSRSLG